MATCTMANVRDHGLPPTLATFITSIVVWFQSVTTSARAMPIVAAKKIAIAKVLECFMILPCRDCLHWVRAVRSSAYLEPCKCEYSVSTTVTTNYDPDWQPGLGFATQCEFAGRLGRYFPSRFFSSRCADHPSPAAHCPVY